jgi:hypothetical protein
MATAINTAILMATAINMPRINGEIPSINGEFMAINGGVLYFN